MFGKRRSLYILETPWFMLPKLSVGAINIVFSCGIVATDARVYFILGVSLK